MSQLSTVRHWNSAFATQDEFCSKLVTTMTLTQSIHNYSIYAR